MKTEYCICVDGGTTNTRATLWRAPQNRGSRLLSVNEMRLAASEKKLVGVRNTSVDGHNSALKSAVRQCLDGVLRQAGCRWQDIGCIMSAGMITSNLGLCELPHLTAPVSTTDLARGVCAVNLPELAPMPIYFVPGVCNFASPVPREKLIQMDMMRGEEVETVALLSQLPQGRSCVVVLPGSHTKFVFVDRDKRIAGCMTTLSGEILDLLTRQSILADAVGAQFAKEDGCDAEYLRRGFGAAAQYGLARAAFGCRIESQFSGAGTGQMASYLMGAVLQQDVQALIALVQQQRMQNPVLFVSGKPPLRQALAHLLARSSQFHRVEELPASEELSARGCLVLAAKKGLLEV